MVEIGIVIAVIVGLNELIKGAFDIPTRYLPLISLLLGVIAGVFYLDGNLAESIFQGVIIGLSASGLFDQSKIITKKGGGI